LFKSLQNKVFKIYLGQLVRYGTEIIKGVGIPQSGQVILLTNKKLVLRRAQPFITYGKLLSRFW
jgi:hypothetical protein